MRSVSTNPTVRWIIAHIPKAKTSGVFYPYWFVHACAYGWKGDMPGKRIRADLQEEVFGLFFFYGVGVQIGVKNDGERGIRLINMK